MNIRLNTDREDFFDDLTEAEISIELAIPTAPRTVLHFQYDDAQAAAQAVQHFWTLGSVYEEFIADLQKENAALVDDLAAAQAQKK